VLRNYCIRDVKSSFISDFIKSVDVVIRMEFAGLLRLFRSVFHVAADALTFLRLVSLLASFGRG
jgi:hypothetical protein